MKIGCIIQARMNSTRLPGKMLMDIGGWPVVRHTIERAKKIGIPVILAIPKASPAGLVEVANRQGIVVSEGDEADVLARYYFAARGMGLDAVMRLCGDQPLLDPIACQRVLDAFQTLYIDWCANDVLPSYPIGLGCEVFSFAALELAHRDAKSVHQREHVSPFIIHDKRLAGRNIRCPINGLSDLRLTIDTQEDLDRIRAIDAAGPKDYSLQSTLGAIDRVKAQNHP